MPSSKNRTELKWNQIPKKLNLKSKFFSERQSND